MEERLNSIWQIIKRHPYAAGLCVLLMFVLFISLAYSFGWDWTGLNSGTNRITITSTSKGNYTATISQPSKSLWDWLQLLGVLAIPAVVGLGATWYTTQQGKVSDEANKKQHETELQIATDNQRENALQAYIDKMSELLFQDHLGELTADGQLKPEYEQVRKIARVRTMTILPRLDANRQKSVLLFLFESGLINTDKAIIDLSGADLREANLKETSLRGANLSETNLSGADLTGADLTGANLRGADLSEVFLSKGDLTKIYTHAKHKRGAITGSMTSYKRNGRLLWGYQIRADGPGYWLKTSLRGANLGGTTLYKADLNRADLFGANLSRADLSETNLRGADLTGANLSRTEMSRAELKGANLREANLREANLREANLTKDHPNQPFEVDDSIVEGDNLGGANLSGANLSGADLKGAFVTKEQLDQAKLLKGAIMPDGTVHP